MKKCESISAQHVTRTIKKALPKEIDIYQAMGYGYFPNGLTPAYKIQLLLNNIISIEKLLNIINMKKIRFDIDTYNIPKTHGARRYIHIPHMLPMLELYKVLRTNWYKYRQFFIQEMDENAIVASIPIKDDEKIRYMIPAFSHSELKKIIMSYYLTKKYIMYVDISDFYNNVYTHSFPWAMVGKSIAKQMHHKILPKTEEYEAGNILDAATRKIKDNETKGIPVGPDSSLIIANIIVLRILKNMKYMFKNKDLDICLLAYVDDIYIFYNQLGIEKQIYDIFIDVLNQYNLYVNKEKVKYQHNHVYYPIELVQISQYQNTGHSQNDALSIKCCKKLFPITRANAYQLANLISLAEGHNNSAPSTDILTRLKYAIRKLQPQYYEKIYKKGQPPIGCPSDDSGSINKKCISNIDKTLAIILSKYPEIIDYIYDIYSFYAIADPDLRFPYFERAIHFLARELQPSRSFELSWVLYSARIFRINLPDSVIQQIISTFNNSYVGIELYMYLISANKIQQYVYKYFCSPFIKQVLKEMTDQHTIYGQNWLIINEILKNPMFKNIRKLMKKHHIKPARAGDIGKINKMLKDIYFYIYKHKLSPKEIVQGYSYKGRGGIRAGDYLNE